MAWKELQPAADEEIAAAKLIDHVEPRDRLFALELEGEPPPAGDRLLARRLKREIGCVQRLSALDPQREIIPGNGNRPAGELIDQLVSDNLAALALEAEFELLVPQTPLLVGAGITKLFRLLLSGGNGGNDGQQRQGGNEEGGAEVCGLVLHRHRVAVGRW